MLETRLGLLQVAMRRLVRSLRIRRAVDDLPGQGISLNNIGLMLMDTCAPRRALLWFAAAVEVHRHTGEHHEHITSLVNLTRLHLQLGEAGDARAWAQLAVDLSEAIDHPEQDEHRMLLEQCSP